MCGGFVGDILDSVSNAVESVGNAVGDTVEAVIHNPVGVIVDVGLLSMGVPPVFAGMAGGAANAAATGGNILEGAALGGVTSYVGGAAGEAAVGAGAGQTLSGAAAGAAGGATGALLTGGNVGQSILGGGVIGGAGGYFGGVPQPGAGDVAPVYNYNPATGMNELVSAGTGIYAPAAAGGGLDIGAGGWNIPETGPAVPSAGAAWAQSNTGMDTYYNNINTMAANGTLNADTMAQYGISPADVQAAVAATAAPATPVEPPYDPYTDQGPSQPGTATPGVGGPVTTEAPTVTVTAPPIVETPVAPVVPYNPYTDQGPSQPGTVTPGVGGPVTTEVPTIDVTAPRIVPPEVPVLPPVAPPVVVPPETPTEITITAPRIVPPEVPVLPPVAPPVVEPPVVEPPVVEPPVVEPPVTPPVIPVIPPVPKVPDAPHTGTYTPMSWGGIPKLNPQAGLNPGFIQPTPFYNTTNNVQSQYSWGAHPFQAGTTFNPKLYNQAAAPEHPWGLQEMFHTLTPAEFKAAYEGHAAPATPVAPATRVEAYNPAAVAAANALAYGPVAP